MGGVDPWKALERKRLIIIMTMIRTRVIVIIIIMTMIRIWMMIIIIIIAKIVRLIIVIMT